MTDEEKAKEMCKGCIYEDDHINCDCPSEYVYLAGLAEGRKEKWHDLRKDPNDLPKNREEVLLYVKLNDKWECNKVVLIGYRDYGYCLGEYCEDWGYVEPIHGCKYDFVDGEEVIAWCELPKFKE